MPEIRISLPKGVDLIALCRDVRPYHLFPPDKEHEYFIDPKKPDTAVCRVACLLCGTIRRERIWAHGRGKARRIGQLEYDHPEGYSRDRERMVDRDDARAELVRIREQPRRRLRAAS